jgi:hypothetical protein
MNSSNAHVNPNTRVHHIKCQLDKARAFPVGIDLKLEIALPLAMAKMRNHGPDAANSSHVTVASNSAGTNVVCNLLAGQTSLRAGSKAPAATRSRIARGTRSDAPSRTAAVSRIATTNATATNANKLATVNNHVAQKKYITITSVALKKSIKPKIRENIVT